MPNHGSANSLPMNPGSIRRPSKFSNISWTTTGVHLRVDWGFISTLGGSSFVVKSLTVVMGCGSLNSNDPDHITKMVTTPIHVYGKKPLNTKIPMTLGIGM